MYKQTITSIIRHRVLVWEMTKKDLKGLNKGALLGSVWIFLNPLIQTSVYIIVVAFIFKSRLNENSSPFDYALYVLSGMIPWQIIVKALQEAPSVIRIRIELVKQVIYPIETLPLSSLIVGSFGSLISFLIFFILTIISGKIVWSFLLLPIPFVLLVLFILGCSWMFSIIGIIIKDLREMVAVILSLLVYLSPVVLNENITGNKLWKLVMLNPLAHIIVSFRDVFNATFHLQSWIIFIIMTFTFLIIGGVIITKTKIKINEYI